MNEVELRELWESERPMFEAWGRLVVRSIEDGLVTRLSPMAIDLFLRIPPTPRLKEENSLISKAFHRGKAYKNPYDEITDKVGVRFVVLLASEIREVETVIQAATIWKSSKDRDYEAENDANPIQFDYAAVHFVLTSIDNNKYDGISIRNGVTCEVQIKTILQHAYSEVTHDTIYKPNLIATPSMKRKAAKSMALIEATNDYFEAVFQEIGEETYENVGASNKLNDLYVKFVKKTPVYTKTESLILSAFAPYIQNDTIARVDEFFRDKDYLIDTIRDKYNIGLLYQQSSILLIYYLADSYSTKTKSLWPLTPETLQPIYTDLSINFSGV